MRLDKNYIIYLFCLLPFLEMPRISYYTQINNVFLMFKCLSALVVGLYCISYFFLNRKLPISKLGICFILYEAVIVSSTFIHHGELVSSISDGLALLIPVLLFDIFIEKISIKKLFLPIIITYFIYVLITLVQEEILNLPVEYYNNGTNYSLIYDEHGFIFAMGHMKRFIFFILPMLTFSIMIAQRKKTSHTVMLLIMFIISFRVLYNTWAVSAMIVVLLLFALYILYKSRYAKKILNFFNFNKFFCVYLLLNFGLISGAILEMLSPILAIFGKTTTLSGRTFLWELGLYLIKQSPVIGYGLNSVALMESLWGLSHFHNLLLNITYTGGLILLFIFIYINVITGKKIVKAKVSNYSMVISIGLYSALILALTDTPDYNMIYAFYVIGYHIDKIYKNEAERQNKQLIDYFKQRSGR